MCNSLCAEVSGHPCISVDSGEWSKVARLHWESPFPTKPSPQPSSMSLTPNDKFLFGRKMFTYVHNGYGQLWTCSLLELGLISACCFVHRW